MRLAHRLTFAASAIGVGLTVACCGKTSPGGAQGDGGSESPCDDYFTAVYEGCLLGSTFPANEMARIRPRYDQWCASMLSLPGMNVTASYLKACAKTAETHGCVVAEQNDCEAGGTLLGPDPFSGAYGGALGGGAACVLGQQCQTYRCSAGSSTADGGTLACGTCSPVIPGGRPCNTGGTCAAGTICVQSAGDAGVATTCVPIAYVGSGAACDGYENECNPGLSCNAATGTCSSPGPAGTACGSDGDCQPGLFCNPTGVAAPDASEPGAVIGTCSPLGQSGTPCDADSDCLPPLVCPGGTCQSPGNAGATCKSDLQCATGLGCGNGVCASVTWAAAGQPCTATARCLVGYCPSTNDTTSGTCPAVIPDGQPCNITSTDSTSVCDTFAQCFEGTCHLTFEGVCP